MLFMFQLLSGAEEVKDGPPVLQNSSIKIFYNRYSFITTSLYFLSILISISGREDASHCLGNIYCHMVTQYATSNSDI